MPRPRKSASPFRYFNSSPEVIRLVVMMYVRFPLSLRNVEDLLAERGIDICAETVRLWWNRFGPMFAARSIRFGELANRSSQVQCPLWVESGHCRSKLDDFALLIYVEFQYRAAGGRE